MKKKLFAVAVTAILLVTAIIAPLISEKQNYASASSYVTGPKNKATDIYCDLVDNLSKFPVSFNYGNEIYNGFGRDFRIIDRNVSQQTDKTSITFDFLHRDNKLLVTLDTAVYPAYGAYEWTVYFSAYGSSKTNVIKNLKSADLQVSGQNPALKGMNGDYTYRYSPYEYNDLSSAKVYTSTRGRPSHDQFPYFNLEHDDGGVIVAVGWPGTWSASFKEVSDGVTHIETTGTVGLNTYLNAGETIRTPLMAFVVYEERDEDLATNAWRKWYIDCNMPKESGELQKGKVATCLPWDTGGDSSITTLQAQNLATYQNFYKHGFYPDINWIDASWYKSVSNGTLTTYKQGAPSTDWFKTGNWSIDTTQWPNMSQVTDYVRANGGKTLLWFEPERVGSSDYKTIQTNTGIKPEWLLPQSSRDRTLFNLGNKDALSYMFNKICSVIDSAKIDHYREDFNTDPNVNWDIADAIQGANRKGITENLHLQGHLKLWDMLLDRYPNMIIDSCASGGGRNDLESMRRAVPYHRTDAEEHNTAKTSIAMNSVMFKWLPYFGSAAYDRNTWTDIEEYNSRAGYAGVYKMVFMFNSASENFYTKVKNYTKEYYEFAKHLYDNYYLLTNWNSSSDTSAWTAWEFFNETNGTGVMQLFREDTCEISSMNVKLKGLNASVNYKLSRFDGTVVCQGTGSYLMNTGYNFTINQKRGSDVLFIAKV
ncbi:MAG: alpha-galactosidase [Clostridia bacterium]|nr:alpha-galactosidase [Clostridia bacterium]